MTLNAKIGGFMNF